MITPDAVIAINGKIDKSRDIPSFNVDEVLNPMELQEKSVSEVHIKIRANMATEQEIQKLQDFLFGLEGNCSVYFHIDIGGKTYTLKAGPSTKISSTEEVLEDITSLPGVIEVWKS